MSELSKPGERNVGQPPAVPQVSVARDIPADIGNASPAEQGIVLTFGSPSSPERPQPAHVTPIFAASERPRDAQQPRGEQISENDVTKGLSTGGQPVRPMDIEGAKEVHMKMPDTSTEHATPIEPGNPKDTSINFFGVSHGDVEGDIAQLEPWAQRTRSVLGENASGKVVLVVEMEDGVKEYSDRVRDAVAEGIKPSRAKAEVAFEMYAGSSQLSAEQKESEIQRLMGIQDVGFEGAINQKLDELVQEFGSDRVVVVHEWQLEESSDEPTPDLQDQITAVVLSDLQPQEKEAQFRAIFTEQVPLMRQRGEHIADIIAQSAEDPEVIECNAVFGAVHNDAVYNLASREYTRLGLEFPEREEDQPYYFMPLMTLIHNGVHNPDYVPTDEEIAVALSSEYALEAQVPDPSMSTQQQLAQEAQFARDFFGDTL